MTTVAVIGCTHAGTFATTSILAEHPDWTVHVFERNGTLSFLSCGIALWVGDHVSDPKKMFYSSPGGKHRPERKCSAPPLPLWPKPARPCICAPT